MKCLLGLFLIMTIGCGKQENVETADSLDNDFDGIHNQSDDHPYFANFDRDHKSLSFQKDNILTELTNSFFKKINHISATMDIKKLRNFLFMHPSSKTLELIKNNALVIHIQSNTDIVYELVSPNITLQDFLDLKKIPSSQVYDFIGPLSRQTHQLAPNHVYAVFSSSPEKLIKYSPFVETQKIIKSTKFSVSAEASYKIQIQPYAHFHRQRINIKDVYLLSHSGHKYRNYQGCYQENYIKEIPRNIFNNSDLTDDLLNSLSRQLSVTQRNSNLSELYLNTLDQKGDLDIVLQSPTNYHLKSKNITHSKVKQAHRHKPYTYCNGDSWTKNTTVPAIIDYDIILEKRTLTPSEKIF